MCDPIRHVSSCSGEAVANCYIRLLAQLYYYYYYYKPDCSSQDAWEYCNKKAVLSQRWPRDAPTKV